MLYQNHQHTFTEHRMLVQLSCWHRKNQPGCTKATVLAMPEGSKPHQSNRNQAKYQQR
jgi:hypothetical protein